MNGLAIIEEWLSEGNYFLVIFRGMSIGCIFSMTHKNFSFRSYDNFDRLDAYAKEMIGQATKEKCALLNFTARLLG